MNIFSKIIKGEIPCEKVYEDEFTLAFKDVKPQAPIHVLVIPKKDIDIFTNVDMKTMEHLINAIKKVVEITNIKNSGYRVVTNTGKDGGQSVKHLHFHVLGGKRVVSKLA